MEQTIGKTENEIGKSLNFPGEVDHSLYPGANIEV